MKNGLSDKNFFLLSPRINQISINTEVCPASHALVYGLTFPHSPLLLFQKAPKSAGAEPNEGMVAPLRCIVSYGLLFRVCFLIRPLLPVGRPLGNSHVDEPQVSPFVHQDVD